MANNHQFGSGNAALDAFKGSDDELDCLLRRLRNPNDYGGIEKHELYELLRVLFRNVYELGSSDYARIAVLLKEFWSPSPDDAPDPFALPLPTISAERIDAFARALQAKSLDGLMIREDLREPMIIHACRIWDQKLCGPDNHGDIDPVAIVKEAYGLCTSLEPPRQPDTPDRTSLRNRYAGEILNLRLSLKNAEEEMWTCGDAEAEEEYLAQWTRKEISPSGRELAAFLKDQGQDKESAAMEDQLERIDELKEARKVALRHYTFELAMARKNIFSLTISAMEKMQESERMQEGYMPASSEFMTE